MVTKNKIKMYIDVNPEITVIILSEARVFSLIFVPALNMVSTVVQNQAI